jgi:hypothetical protein
MCYVIGFNYTIQVFKTRYCSIIYSSISLGQKEIVGLLMKLCKTVCFRDPYRKEEDVYFVSQQS